MLDRIKRLGADTAVYGISTIVGRFLTFILTPFYTNILPPAELGIIATTYAYIAFLNILYAYGMEAAFMRFIVSAEGEAKKKTFSIPFLSVCVTSCIASACLMAGEMPVAGLAGIPLHLSTIVTYAGWILLLDALAVVPFASLRMEQKAGTFAIIKLANIVINVVCNLVLLLEYRLGVEGIFISNIVASAATVVLLLPTIARNLTFRWEGPLFKSLLRFSLPTVPAYIATMMIQVIDRPILESLTDKATVGIYQANYRLGIFMMLLVSMFDFAWRPFFLSQAKESDAKQVFARVLTYVLLAMTAAFLVLTFFLRDAVTMPIVDGISVIDRRYWAGLDIVPVILLAYIFLGISNTIVAGIYIEKQTARLPVVTFVGAGVNVAANYLLIPVMGIMGAAVATLLSYAVMAGVLYGIVQRIYPVPYEYARLAKIVLAVAAVCSMYFLLPLDGLLWKIGLLFLFGLLTFVMKFFERAEVYRLKELFARRPAQNAPEVPPSSGT